jgi:hypothetical protein
MKDFIEQYKKSLLQVQQNIVDKLSNMQREKDFKVQKLEKRYQSKIEKLIQEQSANALRIKITKEFVANTEYSGELIAKKGK